MSYGLLLDSSNTSLNVGLSKDHKVIDSTSYPAWQTQSEKLIPEIDSLLRKHGVERAAVSYVVCAKGPGSYTGIRIALTVAKTISFAFGCQLFLVSSLEVLKSTGPSICLMNARSKRSYIGIYDGEKTLMEDRIMDNPNVLEYIWEHPDFKVCGDVSYLGLESAPFDLIGNLNDSDNERNLCHEPLGARPIYLKDSYMDSEIKITVRKMIPSDMSAVMRIEGECFGPEAYNEEQMRYELLENPVGHILVATVDAVVVGFIDTMITFDSATISQIAVDQKFRKRGVGNILIGDFVKLCKAQDEPVEFITLEVREGNANARRFYKRHGFEEITVKKQYYSDGEDAVYMVRSIVND